MTPSPRKCHDLLVGRATGANSCRPKPLPAKVTLTKKRPNKRPAQQTLIQDYRCNTLGDFGGILRHSSSDISLVKRNKFRKTHPSPKKRCSWRESSSLEEPQNEDSILSTLYDSPVKSFSNFSNCNSNSQPARTLFDDDDHSPHCHDSLSAIFLKENASASGPTDFSHLLNASSVSEGCPPSGSNPTAKSGDLTGFVGPDNRTETGFAEQPVDWRLAHSVTIKSDKKIIKEVTESKYTYFQCPYLPWLPFFPRQFDAVKQCRDKKLLPVHEWTNGSEGARQAILESTVQMWELSLDALYSDLLSGTVQYFYVCCTGFTVLFINDSQANTVCATVSPASRNLEKEMRMNGVDIELYSPYSNKSRQSGDSIASWNGLDDSSRHAYSQPAHMPSMGKENDNDDESSRESATQAIESMDCYTPKTKETLKKRQSLRRSRTEVGSGKKKTKTEECIQINQNSMENLLKFIKSERCRSKSGAYKDMPPTTVANVQFDNSVRRSLNIKSNLEAKKPAKYWMEISGGPILPSLIYDLVEKVEENGSTFECNLGGKNFYSAMCPPIEKNFGNFDELFTGQQAKYTKMEWNGKVYNCS